MQMDTRLPLMAQGPDVLGSYMRGASAADVLNRQKKEQGKRQFLSQYGQALFSGDQNALAAYSQFDLAGATALRNQQQAARARQAAAARAAAAARQRSAKEQQIASARETLATIDSAVASEDPKQIERLLQNPSLRGMANQYNLLNSDGTFNRADYGAVTAGLRARLGLPEQARPDPMAEAKLQGQLLSNRQAEHGLHAPEQQTPAFQTLDARANAAGLVPGSPEYQQFMANNGQPSPGSIKQTEPPKIAEFIRAAELAGIQPGTPEYNAAAAQTFGLDPQGDYKVVDGMLVNLGADGGPTVVVLGQTQGKSAAEQEIARLVSIGIPNDIAIKINAGVYRLSRDPNNGAITVVDLSSGKPVFGQSQGTQGATETGQGGVSDAQLPNAQAQDANGGFPNPGAAFGLKGLVAKGINRGFDMLGAKVPFPDVLTTQTSFDVFNEAMTRNLAGAYARQPPAKIMDALRELSPKTGSVWEGVGAAKDKLGAIKQDLLLQSENIYSRLAMKNLSPAVRQKLQGQAQSLEMALARVNNVLDAFGQKGPAIDLSVGETTTLDGVTIERVE